MPSPGLTARLARARRSLERLKRLAELSPDEYFSNEDYQALAERHLHIVLECILDLAAFIAARRGLARGPTYRDVVRAVVEAGLVPKRLKRIALSVPGMRNVLVQGYAEVRHDIVYDLLRRELGLVEELLAVLAAEAERLDP